MSIVDIALGIILIMAFITGLRKGLFVALASLVGLIVGVYGALYFSDFAAGYISRWFDWSEQTVNLAAFAVTFVGIVYLISTAGKLLTNMAFLGSINKILGGVFQALTVGFILSIVIMFMNSSPAMSSIIPESQTEDSVIYPKVASLAPMVLPHIIDGVEQLKKPGEETDESALK